MATDGRGLGPRDVREPLMRRQESQVSMRVARGSASWLSSHGRGLGQRDALKKDCRGCTKDYMGFPGGLDGKESACNAGDLGLILG